MKMDPIKCFCDYGVSIIELAWTQALQKFENFLSKTFPYQIEIKLVLFCILRVRNLLIAFFVVLIGQIVLEFFNLALFAFPILTSQFIYSIL